MWLVLMGFLLKTSFFLGYEAQDNPFLAPLIEYSMNREKKDAEMPLIEGARKIFNDLMK